MKTNDATYNRPEGARVIDASYVTADIKDVIKQLKDENAWEKNDRNGITLFKTPGTTVVLTCLHEEAVIDNISVDGLVMIEVREGKVNVTTEGDAFELCENKVVFIHENVPHSIYALEKSAILMTSFTG